MNAVRFHQYGAADVLKYETVDDPKPKAGEVLVRIGATSANPIDWKLRSGSHKAQMPLELPYIPGRDLAGEVVEIGENVSGFKVGDRVMGLANHTYAELCVAAASDLTAIPQDLSFEEAASLPLVTLTGDQVVRDGAQAKAGQTILITGALGSVGRCAVFAAQEIGCTILAGVTRNRSEEAALLPGVKGVVALDDEAAVASMQPVDCIANTIAGDVLAKLLDKVREGGVFGTTVQGPHDRAGVRVSYIFAHPDAQTTRDYADAVAAGDLDVPIARRFALADAVEAQRLGEEGANGKIILVP